MSKVVFVLPSLAHGGAQKVFVEIVAYLCEQGRDVTLLVLEKQGELLTQIPAGLKICFLNEYSDKKPNALTWLRAGLRLRRWVQQNQVDTIYSTVTGMNVFTLLLFYFDKDITIVVREASSIENVKSKAQLCAIKYLFPRANCVICTSLYLKHQLESLLRDVPRLEVISNPIDLDRIHRLSREQCEREYFTPPERKRVVAVGRLIPAKGFDILIRAFARLNLKFESTLVIVGDGPERSLLTSLVKELEIEDRVFFEGYSPNPYALMSKCDLFVLSSRWEGYVNTLVEAMALGMPIVASDCNSEPGLFLENSLGKQLVPIDDPESLAKAIAMEIDQPLPDYSLFVAQHQLDVAVQRYMECKNGTK